MIPHDTVEQALRCWPPFQGAIKEVKVSVEVAGRQAMKAAAKQQLEKLGIPATDVMILYLLASALSDDDEKVILPSGDRIYPPAVVTPTEWDSLWGPRDLYIILPPYHPFRLFVQGLKGTRGPERPKGEEAALKCAYLAREGHSEVDIGKRFGWALQPDSYGRPDRRCVTARRYIKKGRELLKKSDGKILLLPQVLPPQGGRTPRLAATVKIKRRYTAEELGKLLVDF